LSNSSVAFPDISVFLPVHQGGPFLVWLGFILWFVHNTRPCADASQLLACRSLLVLFCYDFSCILSLQVICFIPLLVLLILSLDLLAFEFLNLVITSYPLMAGVAS
jgi:hypothetical protein